MKPKKAIEKCAADYCRQLAIGDGVFCEPHGIEWDEKMGTRPPKDPVLNYVASCFVCSYESFHDMTASQRSRLINMICPTCSNMSLTMERVELQRAA